ncbi:zinc ribbon-containing protein [Entomospira culicis]|uniref:Zinc ribbon-containing protein n=1 Tax=Entomospira culicis TaxID=2719989 RepID=A0A968GGR6_9SPIO|nr:zinc ribbon-containing protein [Entomospira culicis]NIZ70194.1 zinc ribbon-containing protein [Entomospira culicis]
MKASTGEKCPKSGNWVCTKCKQVHRMDAGETMPPCSKCNHTEFKLS